MSKNESKSSTYIDLIVFMIELGNPIICGLKLENET